MDGEKKFITCEVRCGCHPTAGGGPTLDRGGQSEGHSTTTTLETRGVTPPNGRHTQTPSTYSPVFVPLRRHPRPMALASKCPRRKVGGFSARAARCPRRSTSLCPSRRERLIFLDRDDSAGPASHHRPLLAARPVAEALSIKASVGDVAHVAFAAVYRGQRKIGCPVRYSWKA